MIIMFINGTIAIFMRIGILLASFLTTKNNSGLPQYRQSSAEYAGLPPGKLTVCC